MPAGAILAKLATDPVWGALLAEFGTGIISGLLGGGGEAPFERASAAQLRAGEGVLSDLQRASSGLPTAAGRAITRQVQREGTAMQQSLAASSRRAGHLGTPSGTSPFRAQSERIQAGQQEALIQRLGQHQMGAQQMLLSGLQPAIQTQAGFQRQGQQTEQFVKGALGRLGRHLREDPEDEQTNRLLKLLEQLIGGGGDGGVAPRPQKPFAEQFSIQ